MFELQEEEGMKKKDWLEANKIRSQSYIAAFGFFFRQSFKDARRHKCQYWLGFSSVFVVVIMTLIINTIIDKGPIIFLRLAEGSVGEIDGLIQSTDNGESDTVSQNLVNLTQFNILYPDEYLLSPRKQSFASYYVPLSTGSYSTDSQTGLLTYTSSQSSSMSFDDTKELKIINIDTEQEKENNWGKDYKLEKLNLGEWVVNEDFVSSSNLKEGDNIFFSFVITQELQILYDHFKVRTGANPASEPNFGGTVIAPCKYVGSFTSSGGKLPNSDSSKAIFMEIEYFFKWVAPYVEVGDTDPTTVQFREFLKGEHSRAYDLADYVVMNFPDPRTDYYKYSDYDELQNNVVGYVNGISDKWGFFPQIVHTDILEELQTLSLGLVFLGIIFSIVAVLFIVISILLIYSLLMATVEEKSFEIGIYRMVGVNKLGLITMVLLKAFFFVVPAIVTGFILSILFLWMIYTFFLNSSMGVNEAPIPTINATLYALLVGLIIPILSSLYPMRVVLSKTLTDALNYSTSKTKAVFVQIIHSKDFDKRPYIVFGSISVIYGLSIYYFLPLSLISLNFALMLSIFFMILIGMFWGMVLLALNLQRILEIFFVYIFLFYEHASTRMIVLKNMIAHKPRNRTTILIYAMSVGFLVMIIVSYNLEIQNTSAITQLEEGHYLYILAPTNFGFSALFVESLISGSKEKIEYLGYETHETEDAALSISYKNLITSDDLGLIEFESSITGVTPFFGHTLMEQYLKMESQNTSTSLDVIEQLFTPRGMQSVGVPAYIRKRLGLDPYNYKDTLRTTLYTSNWNVHLTQRALWSTKLFPGKDMIERENTFGYDTITSLPTFKKLTAVQTSTKNLRFRKLAIKLKNPNNKKDIDEVRDALDQSITATRATIYDHINDKGNLDTAASILDLIFNVIIGSVMFLCYFALSSSMTANMIEQKKEIGVLRAIGIKKRRIYFLYIYEWFIMIFTGWMTGILVGTMIGWTMMLQRVLFTNVPIPFYFPWMQVIVMFFLSIIWAVLATIFPARQILKNEISQIFRS